MLSHNNTNHSQETLTDMWAQGEALKALSHRWISARQSLLLSILAVLALVLYFSCSLSLSVPLSLFSSSINPMLLTDSHSAAPASVCGSEHLWLHSNLRCYLFSSDQLFITHMEGWLRMRELPGLVAGSLDLSISVCLLLFHSLVSSLSFTLSPTHWLTHLSCSC